ncbi:MAG: histidinol-phosphatase [Armatimonadetes bacterium]|nr:histidinol-phosphatase [Armatimonadota bacterium]
MQPWMVSLHGGHSGDYCDHAQGTLREIIETAIRMGFHTYGLAEHMPRVEDRFIYSEERSMGWDVEHLHRMFDAYAVETRALAEEYADRIVILRGFEAEVIPQDRYPDLIRQTLDRYQFDFFVGSAHYVREIIIDGPDEQFAHAIEVYDGLENMAVAYYETVADLIEAVSPPVIGHFDLVKKRARPHGPVDGPRAREAAYHALTLAKQHDCILDLNLAGWRKGLNEPYPAPWIVEMARELGIDFCFGDDSHGPHQVGENIEKGRLYLLEHGVKHIRALKPGGQSDVISLEA